MDDIQGLVGKVHAQWRAAIEEAGRECDARSLHNLAERYRGCGLFKGTEDLESLVGLLTSPQGAEFCMRYRFPNLAVFRLFKAFSPERYNVYIDAGRMTLRNPEKAVLVGRTSAVVDCDTLAAHRIFLMHGARAVINASGWAVVRVEASAGCQVIRNVTDNAVIL